ncbi:response regulator transcription factor [Streptomyces sp. NPDC094149]|uniref:response regulator transcription factor n=1 Tax=Streptomyces sp. NPDC094149 TaxID=3155079 RepID=UPI003332EB6C
MDVLLVEDEVELAGMLADGLRGEGMDVRVAHDGARALELTAASEFAVVVLDRDLPGISGDAVCRTLVSSGYPARILMLTAAGSVSDRVDGLTLGADDYLAKPFAYVELVARIHALGRRHGAPGPPTVLERKGVRLDTGRRLAERDSRPLALTRKELGVLEVLLLADGGIVTTRELLEQVWDPYLTPETTAVKVAVYQLRRKLGEPPLIETVPRFGYRL